MSDPPTELTLLLQRPGMDEAQLMALVYDQLKALARARLGHEPIGHTLQPTALVHEVWMRLAGPEGERLPWESRAHFFGAAATAMRHILVDRSRRVQSEKHGGLHVHQPLDAVDVALDPDKLDFEALDGALEKLMARDERAARVVELRFFAGLSVEDTALALDLSERTVAREWSVARAFLVREMERDAG